MHAKYSVLTLLLSAWLITSCDRHPTIGDQIIAGLKCDWLTQCPGRSTRFGMVGDSWTDFAGGFQLTFDLHDILIQQFGYSITSAVIAGQTLETEANSFRGFERVIQTAGPDLRYMLISLGGNDILRSTGEYQNQGAELTFTRRLDRIEQNLRGMITYGDLLKQTLHGGAPLIWIIHGYDYANPDVNVSCVQGAMSAGMSVSQANQLAVDMVDRLNGRYAALTAGIPGLRYIDLRGTLGGPPRSQASLKFDCIHPNTQGFALLGARYAASIEAAAPGEAGYR